MQRPLESAAETIGETLQHELASYKTIATALEPLASKFAQADGTALLEHLLDLIGLSTGALVKQVGAASSNTDFHAPLMELARRLKQLETNDDTDVGSTGPIRQTENV